MHEEERRAIDEEQAAIDKQRAIDEQQRRAQARIFKEYELVVLVGLDPDIDAVVAATFTGDAPKDDSHAIPATVPG